MDRLQQLHDAGVSIWLDSSRANCWERISFECTPDLADDTEDDTHRAAEALVAERVPALRVSADSS
jgi:hypothetical protein